MFSMCCFDDASLIEEGVYENTATETWLEEENIVFANELSEEVLFAPKLLIVIGCLSK